jgi:hypothetical protein
MFYEALRLIGPQRSARINEITKINFLNIAERSQLVAVVIESKIDFLQLLYIAVHPAKMKSNSKII